MSPVNDPNFEKLVFMGNSQHGNPMCAFSDMACPSLALLHNAALALKRRDQLFAVTLQNGFLEVRLALLLLPHMHSRCVDRCDSLVITSGVPWARLLQVTYINAIMPSIQSNTNMLLRVL